MMDEMSAIPQIRGYIEAGDFDMALRMIGCRDSGLSRSDKEWLLDQINEARAESQTIPATSAEPRKRELFTRPPFALPS